MKEAASGFPEVSFAPVPTDTVYGVLYFRRLVGSKVIVFPLQLKVPFTLLPPSLSEKAVSAEVMFICSEKVTDTLAANTTPVAPLPGLTAVTAG
jgi:hypothetical protein